MTDATRPPAIAVHLTDAQCDVILDALRAALMGRRPANVLEVVEALCVVRGQVEVVRENWRTGKVYRAIAKAAEDAAELREMADADVAIRLTEEIRGKLDLTSYESTLVSEAIDRLARAGGGPRGEGED